MSTIAAAVLAGLASWLIPRHWKQDEMYANPMKWIWQNNVVRVLSPLLLSGGGGASERVSETWRKTLIQLLITLTYRYPFRYSGTGRICKAEGRNFLIFIHTGDDCSLCPLNVLSLLLAVYWAIIVQIDPRTTYRPIDNIKLTHWRWSRTVKCHETDHDHHGQFIREITPPPRTSKQHKVLIN